MFFEWDVFPMPDGDKKHCLLDEEWIFLHRLTILRIVRKNFSRQTPRLLQNLQTMKFIYYGHSCFAVETGGKILLFDPFVSQNDLARDAGVSAGKLAADAIFVSHGHFDHVGDAKDIAIRTGAPVVGCYELCSWLAQAGVQEIRPLNLGGKAVSRLIRRVNCRVRLFFRF